MNLEKYNEVFKNVFEVEDSELNECFKFGEAPNWDSLAHMELIAQLEDTFEIMFDIINKLKHDFNRIKIRFNVE